MNRVLKLFFASLAALVIVDARAQPDEAPDACLIVSEIRTSEVSESGELKASLRDGREVVIELDEAGCPQLSFHGRFTYGATGGRLCPGRDYVIARSGEFCRILSIHSVTAEEEQASPD